MPIRPDAYAHSQIAAIITQLRQARLERDMPPRQLADQLGVTSASLGRWEFDRQWGVDDYKAYPKLLNLIRWAWYFGFRLVLVNDQTGRQGHPGGTDELVGESWEALEICRLGLTLRAKRERLKLRQRDVAVLLEVTVQSVGRWEGAPSSDDFPNPRPIGLVVWANALGFRVELGTPTRRRVLS